MLCSVLLCGLLGCSRFEEQSQDAAPEASAFAAWPRLVYSCSYVVRSERASFPIRRVAGVDVSPGVLIQATTLGEGKAWIEFDALNEEFTELQRRSTLRNEASASDRDRTRTFIEHQIVASDRRQVMQCISEDAVPARVRNELFELSYFADSGQMNLEASPASTVFYSLSQFYQPLPTKRASVDKLAAWKVSHQPASEVIALLRLESPNLTGVRYSVAMHPKDLDRPLACWLRTSDDDLSILFSAYKYAVEDAKRAEHPVPATVLQVQCVDGQVEIERLTIREFQAGVNDEEARLQVVTPRSVFDLRQQPARRLVSWLDLPVEARAMVLVEDR